MPPTNTELKKETRNDLSDEVPRPGCLYTGPTVITFETAAGVPKMRVLSPWTKKTNIAATVAGATNPAACGTPGTGANGLGSSTGALIDVLDLNIMYVQAVPAVGSADANAPANNNAPTNVTCANASGSTPPGWYYRTGSTYIARFPAASEITPSGTSSLVHYGCRAGDLYVKGTIGGQITIAAENYIYVTGDLTYLDKQSDMLGLIGTNAIYVWNPVSSTSGTSLLSGVHDREIDAAILSVAHTFQVQNYDRGDRGTLTIFGAIAQKFRGSVGLSSGEGYTKDYQYDSRFRNTAPPKFLTPVSTTYGVTQFATVPAAFDAMGRPHRDARDRDAARVRRPARARDRILPERGRVPRSGGPLADPGLGVPELRHRDPQARQHPGRLLAAAPRQVPRVRPADLAPLPARRGGHGRRLRARDRPVRPRDARGADRSGCRSPARSSWSRS